VLIVILFALQPAGIEVIVNTGAAKPVNPGLMFTVPPVFTLPSGIALAVASGV